MASLKALAARLASQACDHVALPARAAVTLQYVFLRPTRDGGPAPASWHALWDSGGDQTVTGMRDHLHAPPGPSTTPHSGSPGPLHSPNRSAVYLSYQR